VLLYESAGITIDPELRLVTGVRRHSQGWLYGDDSRIDVLNPLEGPTSLWPLMIRHGWALGYGQRHLFCPHRQAMRLDNWVKSHAWRALMQYPRYRDVIRAQWPRELGLDDELVRIGLRSRPIAEGRRLTTREYTIVWRNEAAFRRVAKENPRLLPLVMGLADEYEDGLLPQGQDPIAHLKERFRESGTTPAGWRYVARHGARLFRDAWSNDGPYTPFATASAYLYAMERAGLPPPPPRSIAKQLATAEGAVEAAFGGHDELEGCLPYDVLALALREADRRRRRPDLADLCRDMSEACRWPAGMLPPLDDNQMRAGWASFMRRARREFTRSAAELARTGRDWRTTFSELEFAGLRAVPIDSKAALRSEGDRMRNCLADYAEWCRIGMVQIVSFRDAAKGHPVGDAAYERQPLSRGVTWRLIEVKEFANAQPSDRIRRLALACEDVLNVVDLAGPAREVRRRLRFAG
jgi:hypothetical protein